MDILKVFTQKKIFKKSRVTPNSDFFWSIILFSVCMVIVVFSVFGVLTFMRISKAPIFESGSASGKTQIINKDRINNALGKFSERLKKAEQIITSPSPVVDPSL